MSQRNTDTESGPDMYTSNNNNYLEDNHKNDMKEQTDLSGEDIKKEKRGMYKNVVLVSFSFMLLFCAFESMSKLQSSINSVRISPFTKSTT